MMNNLTGKKLATKNLFNNDTMHMSAFKFDVIVTAAGVPLNIRITEKCASSLLIRVK